MFPPRGVRTMVTSLFLALVACGGGDDDDGDDATDGPPAETDIGGWYAVVSHQGGECGGLLSDTAFPPTHLFVEEAYGVFIVRYCDGTVLADCHATPYYDFDQPITDGWAAEGGSAAFSASCTLSWQRATATLRDGELLIRAHDYMAIVEIPQEQCTLEAAAVLTEPCSYEIQVRAQGM